jgi:hypothetical protein
MAHAHHHHGESLKDYFTEQLLTLLVCGLFGFVGIELVLQNRLVDLVTPNFYPWVLGGGITVVVMVCFRAIAVWKEAGEYKAASQANGDGCGLDHTHGADCNHVHIPGEDDDAEHDHSHSHDLSWFFARMLILVFPIGLFFLGLPKGGLSAEEQLNRAGKDSSLGIADLKELAKDATVLDEKRDGDQVIRKLKTRTGLTLRETVQKDGKNRLEVEGGEGITMRFNELNDAAADAGKREYLQGQTIILEGRFNRLADREFTLLRMKMACCVADSVMLKVRIITPQSLGEFTPGEWVHVKGQLQFLNAPGKGYVPVLMVADMRDVQKKEAPRNESE